jgi:hypothetical protein
MARFRAVTTALLVLAFAAATAATTYASRSDDGSSGSRRIALRDDCDPRDPAWAAVGGCANRRGNVSFAEFNSELDSPLAAAVVGHQAWRFDPTYVVLREGKSLRVTNRGGRPHTFTRVANYGGGKLPIPPVNEGLVTAPECPASVDIPPGGSMRVSGLTVGNHRFQCCLHPWQRALVKVVPRSSRHGDDG